MLYDTSNPLQREQFSARARKLADSGKVVELKEKRPQRSSEQNRYLHVILGYFGTETGNTLDYVKERYFKYLCNKDLFLVVKEDKFLGRVNTLRSSADLTTDEMTTAIERFRNWAASEAGIYLCSPDDDRMLRLMEVEIERNKEFI